MKDEMTKKLMNAVELQDQTYAYEQCVKVKVMEDGEEDEETKEVDEFTLDERLASVDVSEDVTALTQGEELSEEFKTKAATIFEIRCQIKTSF